MPQVTHVFAISIVWLGDSVTHTATPHLTYLIAVCIAELRVSVYSMVMQYTEYSKKNVFRGCGKRVGKVG